MRLDEAVPGEWVFIRHEIDCDHADKTGSERACQSFLDSFLGDRFSLVSKKLSPVVLRDEKGNQVKEKWSANIGLLAQEPVLKWHAEVLSKELNRKVYPKRFAKEDWLGLNGNEQKEKLSKFVKLPRIVKYFPYCYEHQNKFAVFFFDESVPCQEKEAQVNSAA